MALQLGPKPHPLRLLDAMVELVGDVWGGHVEPPHHARDAIRPRGEIEQQICLGLGFRGLHGDGAFDPGRGH